MRTGSLFELDEVGAAFWRSMERLPTRLGEGLDRLAAYTK
jgi:hypothetical protein